MKAVWPTLVVTWVAFAQVISFQGLAIWVVVGSVLVALAVTMFIGARRRVWGLLLMVSLPLLIAFLAESFGGTSAGPITRSALMATACAASMAVIVHTRYPHLILVPSLALLAGALGLGAAENAFAISGLWVVAAGVTLAMIGPIRQRDLRESTRLIPFASVLVMSGLVAVATLLVLVPLLPDPWVMGGTSPASDAASELGSVVTQPASSAESATSTSPVTDVVNVLRWVVLAVALVCLLVILVVLARLAWARWQWWRFRRRLASGTADARVVGAWTWLRMQRLRRDAGLPVHLSPDVAMRWAASNGEPDVGLVATMATSVLHQGRSIPPESIDEAWVAARRGSKVSPGSLRTRIRWGMRTPRVTRAL